MISITPHHLNTTTDTPLLDLLQLDQLKLIPGRIPTRRLMELWGVSQPSVSRRMSAIGAVGVVTVIARWGAYQVLDTPPSVSTGRLRLHSTNMPCVQQRIAAANRWDAARQRLRERCG